MRVTGSESALSGKAKVCFSIEVSTPGSAAREAADSIGAESTTKMKDSGTLCSQAHVSVESSTHVASNILALVGMPLRRLPLSSGGLVHVRAQCPFCPHLAHFVRSIREVLYISLGRAVLKRRKGFFVFEFRWLLSVIAFSARPLPRALPVEGGRFLKNPLLRVFL